MHIGNPKNSPGFWVQTGSTLAIAAAWGGKQMLALFGVSSFWYKLFSVCHHKCKTPDAACHAGGLILCRDENRGRERERRLLPYGRIGGGSKGQVKGREQRERGQAAHAQEFAFLRPGLGVA